MREKLLIIDDEEWYHEPIFDRLDYGGIKYDYFKNGVQGLNRFMNAKENEYAAIILDMKIPFGKELRNYASKFSVAGLFILEKIREINKSIPILCYTVLSNEETKNEILKFDAKHIVKTQDSMDEILNEIFEISNSTKGQSGD